MTATEAVVMLIVGLFVMAAGVVVGNIWVAGFGCWLMWVPATVEWAVYRAWRLG